MPGESDVGSAFPDDLLWLERPDDREALDWSQRHTRLTRARLRAEERYERVNQELAWVLSGPPRQPAIILAGGKLLRLLITDEHRFGLLQTASRAKADSSMTWRTVLDLGELRKRTSVAYELIDFDHWSAGACLPPEFDRCLLRLSPGGVDEVEIREFDLERGEFVDDGFNVPTSRVVIEWVSRDLVLVADTSDPCAARTAAGHPAEIKLWLRGQPLAAAQVVYRVAPNDSLVWLCSGGVGPKRYTVIGRSIDLSRQVIHWIDAEGRMERLPFPEDCARTLIGPQTVLAGPEALYFQLRREVEFLGKTYPANAFLSYAVDPSLPADERVRMVFVPEQGDVIDGPAVTTRGHLAFVVKRGLAPRLICAPANGSAESRELIQAETGSAITRLAADHVSDDVLVTIEGFVTPSRQLLCRSSEPPRQVAEDVQLIAGSDFTTETGSVRSKDGTAIDYLMLRPKVTRWTSGQPLLVTGYAAFGLSFEPTYFSHDVGGPSFKLWLERGGSLVVPAARGGGERGEAWHRAAMRENRQRSYDDFIAVIEALHESGYSRPERTGVFGLSNGGLLAAVLATQRPDLFGAVISDVPLTDMIRMKHMGMGRACIDEFGDPEDPELLRVLEGYSPLHNVRAGVRYPPFFITTSTADNRVGPGHARKLAARLESVGATVHFYEATEGGHSVSDPYRNPEIMALRMTFLISKLMCD